MLIDLNTCLKPVLYLTDAIVGMEGNGPTSGTPRHIGALLASQDPYGLDLLCAHLIGLSPEQVPTIVAAVKRGLGSMALSDLQIIGDPAPYVVPDYQNITKPDSIEFSSVVPQFALPFVRRILKARPVPEKNTCIGCEKCREICPAKAIHMQEKKPVIDTKKCIRCFCCQEFCPVGAMKVHRSWLARRLS